MTVECWRFIKRLKYQGNYPHTHTIRQAGERDKNGFSAWIWMSLGEMCCCRKADNLDLDLLSIKKKKCTHEKKTVQSKSARNERYFHSQNDHLHHNYWSIHCAIEWLKRIDMMRFGWKFTYEYYISNHNRKTNFITFLLLLFVCWLLFSIYHFVVVALSFHRRCSVAPIIFIIHNNLYPSMVFIII